ncbi:hypothetical protein [Eremococcus coleocola]|uniref:Chain length determinant protein n=1 Tax=Eremococcus coleocola ACS-139-V-Col8 TaxID=908337 RepID=E4KPV3_9LACT|nr:hypothetical protein [Eremococcus coleocola]EFR31332.1 hypothetical protein HMPREF9257_1592 [Eremococcus coleocola ACS-139-V-Col8]
MSITTLLAELWRFLKDNLFRIILGALVFAGLAVGVRFALDHLILNKNQVAYNYLEQVYQSEPAEFQAIVTIDDGSVFNNSYVFDQYFTSEAVVKKIEAKTQVPISKMLQAEKDLELRKSSEFRGGIAGIRDTSSSAITFRFVVSPDPNENLKVAQAYADLLESEDKPFGDKQAITMITEPQIGELLDPKLTPEVETATALSPYGHTSPVMFGVYGVAGFVVGIFLTILILFIRQLMRKQIVYAFDYAWDFHDRQILVAAKDKGQASPLVDRLLGILAIPYGHRHLVVTQGDNNLETEKIQVLNETTQVVNDLVTDQASLEEIDEIVILIYSNQTSKAWYKAQKELAALYRKPLRIIQVV